MKDFNLSRWAIEHADFTRFLSALLMIIGVFAYLQLGRKEDPDFTFRVMVVQAYWPGATAREMEQQVTDVLEKKLQETPNLDRTQSYSKPGESTIMVFASQQARAAEIKDTWYQVRKKINDIRNQLPDGVVGPFFNDEFGDTYIAMYTLTADGFSQAELKDYADHTRNRLLSISGVEKVDLLGEQAQKIYVEFSQRRLAELGLSLDQLAAELQGQNAMAPAGSIESPQLAIPMRISGDYDSVRAIAELPLRANGHAYQLKDFAHVYRGYEDPPSYQIRHQGRDALMLGVVMARGGDVLKVGDALREEAARVQGDLPVGVEITQVSDQPKVVAESIGTFVHSLAEAVIIVLIVSFFSLGRRAGMVVALSIPLVLAVTFFIMQIEGIDLQKVSLGALVIALGLLVDDAMIAVEMMARKLEEGWDRLSAASYAFKSTAFPMLTGTLITAAGFLPIAFARSAAGEYTFSIFAVTAIALLVSWFTSVYFTPFIGFRLLKPAEHPHAAEERFDSPFYRWLENLVRGCLRHRYSVIAGTVLVLVAALASFSIIPQQFFPNSSRVEVMVDLWLPESASFTQTREMALRLERFLAQQPEVTDYVDYVGGGSPRFYLPLDQQLRFKNLTQFMVVAKDLEAREALVQKIRQEVSEYPEVRSKVDRLVNGPPVGWAVQFRVSGPDAQQVRTIANQVSEVIASNPEVFNLHDNWHEPIMDVHVDVDQDKLRLLGISSKQVRQASQAVLNGVPIGRYRERNNDIDVVARQPQDERSSLGAVRDAYMPTATGQSVPFTHFSNPHVEFEPGIIWRRNRLPTINLQGLVPDGVQAPDVTKRIDQQLNTLRQTLPYGYSIAAGGAYEESGIAQGSINANMPMLMVLILLLLMIQLQHFGRAMLVFLTAPLGLIGAALALLIFHQPFGFVAILGVIALSGMIMRNSVILVDQIEQDQKAGMSPWTAIIGSTLRRFRPIALTAAAAVLAMIPLTRNVFFGPMAYALMGGLVVATVLTLTFLPALYAAWFRIQEE